MLQQSRLNRRLTLKPGKEAECHNVVLSLDGRKEVNDRFRVDCAGNGSYDRIVPKFQKFVKKRGDKNYYMRGTYTHYNTDFTNDIFHMADLGFTELSMEPVVCDPSDPSALTEADLPILFRHSVGNPYPSSIHDRAPEKRPPACTNICSEFITQ